MNQTDKSILQREEAVGGQSEVGVLRRVLLKHPGEAFPPEEILELQGESLNYSRKPDPTRAADEHDALVDLLEHLGAEVQLLPAHPGTTMDSMYVRDASILTDGGIILCRMGKEARAGEPEAQAEAFHSGGVPVLGAIEGTGQLEGGDFIWLNGRTAAVGRGYRTNDEGVRQLEAMLDGYAEELVVVPLPHWKGPSDVFHLMSVISPIDTDLALVYSPLLPVPFRELLLSRGIGLVEVPDGEFDTMACNVLAVGPRVCVMLEGNPETQLRLEDAGVEVHTYRGLEISHPGEGGPTCLTRPLLREP
jgi:N-dimethylarginine dimethylaminohydrolase